MVKRMPSQTPFLSDVWPGRSEQSQSVTLRTSDVALFMRVHLWGWRGFMQEDAKSERDLLARPFKVKKIAGRPEFWLNVDQSIFESSMRRPAS
jgi:hypothetical protein